MGKVSAAPHKTLLSPVDHTLILIDHQSQMAFATKSIGAIELRNNAGLVAHAAQVNAIGKPRIVLAGLWTSVSSVGPALSASASAHYRPQRLLGSARRRLRVLN